MIVASIDSGYNGPSKSKSLNVLETVLCHLKQEFDKTGLIFLENRIVREIEFD